MVQRGKSSIIAYSNLILEYGDIVTIIGEGDIGKRAFDLLHK
ncbi:MAG: hypothetical protein WBH83_07665 [Methanosarcina flavescens]